MKNSINNNISCDSSRRYVSRNVKEMNEKWSDFW